MVSSHTPHNLVMDTLEPGAQLGNSGPSVLPKVTVDMTTPTGYGSGAHCTVKTWMVTSADLSAIYHRPTQSRPVTDSYIIISLTTWKCS